MLARELLHLLPEGGSSWFQKAEKPPLRLISRCHVSTKSSSVSSCQASALRAVSAVFLSNFKVHLQNPSAAVRLLRCSSSSRRSLRRTFVFLLLPSLPGPPDMSRHPLVSKVKHGRRNCQIWPLGSQQQLPEQQVEVEMLRLCTSQTCLRILNLDSSLFRPSWRFSFSLSFTASCSKQAWY